MTNNLNLYNKKRNFNKTTEPKAKKEKSNNKLKFVVQHHLARKDHYDLRLEWKGVLKSWAVPKGPSYNDKDKRLAILVEDHPLEYRNFEGVIPKGEYGGGIVMLFDEGNYKPLNDFNKGLKKGILKFELKGKRLKGSWSLIHFKENNWLLIKEKDDFYEYDDISTIKTSIRTNRTMKEIENNINLNFNDIKLTNPNKLIYKNPNIKKIDVLKYYQTVSERMLPYLENRIISVIRAPEGIDKDCFFKKHLEKKSNGIKKVILTNKDNKPEDYYYITNIDGLLNEVQMNSIEYHVWGSKIDNLEKPDTMVFDLDPDDKLSLKKIRQGVKDLKSILDEFNLKSFLKTSGGKGYHVVVPIKNVTWDDFRKISKNIAELMEAKWPNKYTSNIRKKERKGKIFVDWVRNTRGATSIAPYSLRIRKNAPVSIPIAWDELNKIKPNSITIKKAINRIKQKDPWEDYFKE